MNLPEITEQDRSELIGWIRQQEEERRLRDPVHYFQLQYPDGSHADHDVYEMHLSEATALNEQKLFGYMASQRNRAEKLAEWKARVKRAEAQADIDFKTLRQRAADASLADLPLPDSKDAWQLLEWRRAHVAEVSPPEPRVIPPPDIPYTTADALWVRCAGVGNAIRMPNTLRYEHD